MNFVFFIVRVVEVQGSAAGELVDGWLVVGLAAGGAGLEGRGVIVVLFFGGSWTATGWFRHGCYRFV